MTNIQKSKSGSKIIKDIFLESLEQVFHDHIRGDASIKEWRLHPAVADYKPIVNKLKLVLSWVKGNEVSGMNTRQVMRDIIDQYKKYNHSDYMTAKYGENKNDRNMIQ